MWWSWRCCRYAYILFCLGERAHFHGKISTLLRCWVCETSNITRNIVCATYFTISIDINRNSSLSVVPSNRIKYAKDDPKRKKNEYIYSVTESERERKKTTTTEEWWKKKKKICMQTSVQLLLQSHYTIKGMRFVMLEMFASYHFLTICVHLFHSLRRFRSSFVANQRAP